MEARISREFQEFTIIYGRTEKKTYAVCPACEEHGRQIVTPGVMATNRIGQSIERYYRCRHPNCGIIYKSVEKNDLSVSPPAKKA